MKLKISQILAGVSALNYLATKPFSPVTSMKIARLSARLMPEAELAEKQRNKLIEESGATLAEDNSHYKFPDQGAGQKFAQQWDEVVASEVDVHIDPLPIKALGDTQITPATMHGLLPLLFVEEAVATEVAKPEIVKKKQKAG
jgi:hypothetical protein